MNQFRKISPRMGASAASVLAMLVGAILLLAIGFVLGWGVADELGGDRDEASGAGANPASSQITSADLEAHIDRIAAGVADRLQRQAEANGPEQAERVANMVVDKLRGRTRPSPRPTPSEASSGGKPPIVFDPPEIDFGTILPDTELRGTVQIRNTGDEPLTVVAMRPDCKCTTVEDLTGRVIEPGGSLELTAVIDAPSFQGTRHNEIRFLFEGEQRYDPVAVKLVSDVVGPIRVEPTYFNLSDQVTGVVALHSTDGRPFRVLAANGRPPVYANDFDPETSGPQEGYLLDWDMSMYDPMTCEDPAGNPMPTWWVIETDHPDAPIVDVFVRHYPCTLPEPLNGRRWVLSEQRVVLGELSPGESAEFSVYLKWHGDEPPDDTIREVRSESEQFDAMLVDLDRQGDRITCRVRITPHSDVRGLLYGAVRFFAANVADHSQPLTVIARVADSSAASAQTP